MPSSNKGPYPPGGNYHLIFRERELPPDRRARLAEVYDLFRRRMLAVGGIDVGDFVVKDSGARQQFEGGMVRDTTEGKTMYELVFDGPLVERLAVHLTKGAKKYAARNWMLASDEKALARFKDSAIRHMTQWIRGDQDEDHFAAVVFNLNGYEYVKARLESQRIGKEG